MHNFIDFVGHHLNRTQIHWTIERRGSQRRSFVLEKKNWALYSCKVIMLLCISSFFRNKNTHKVCDNDIATDIMYTVMLDFKLANILRQFSSLKHEAHLGSTFEWLWSLRDCIQKKRNEIKRQHNLKCMYDSLLRSGNANLSRSVKFLILSWCVHLIGKKLAWLTSIGI